VTLLEGCAKGWLLAQGDESGDEELNGMEQLGATQEWWRGEEELSHRCSGRHARGWLPANDVVGYSAPKPIPVLFG